MICNIVFDFNGTMIFDNIIQKRAWQEMLQNLLERAITESEFALHVAGRTNQDSFQYFLQTDLSNSKLQELSAEKETIYQILCLKDNQNFKLVEGLSDFLDVCKANGIRLNIATASEIDNVQFFFKHLNLDQWFDINKVAYNDGDLPGKPAPDLFLRGMQLIEAKPSETVIIEDSKSGIIAAKAARAAEVFQIVDNEAAEHYVDPSRVITNYSALINRIITK